MFEIKRNKAGQQQVIFKASGIVAKTLPNRKLCKLWLEENYPDYVEGSALETIRKATERACKAIKQLNAPLPASYVLNATVGRSVWRAS